MCDLIKISSLTDHYYQNVPDEYWEKFTDFLEPYLSLPIYITDFIDMIIDRLDADIDFDSELNLFKSYYSNVDFSCFKDSDIKFNLNISFLNSIELESWIIMMYRNNHIDS